eukprot:5157734-Alexandrium_andersonii.AAC.1
MHSQAISGGASSSHEHSRKTAEFGNAMPAISGVASPESAVASVTQQHLGVGVRGVVRGAAAAAAGAAGAVVAAFGRTSDGDGG